MTAKKPAAWGQCQCGRRMRAANRYGVCGRCRQAELNAQRCRERSQRAKNTFQQRTVATTTEIGMARRLALQARADATELGHDIPVMEEDATPGAWVGRCRACGGFVCVDIVEEPRAFGRAHHTVCQGAPEYRPAERRDPYTDPVAYATASLEAADREPSQFDDKATMAAERRRWA